MRETAGARCPLLSSIPGWNKKDLEAPQAQPTEGARKACTGPKHTIQKLGYRVTTVYSRCSVHTVMCPAFSVPWTFNFKRSSQHIAWIYAYFTLSFVYLWTHILLHIEYSYIWQMWTIPYVQLFKRTIHRQAAKASTAFNILIVTNSLQVFLLEH